MREDLVYFRNLKNLNLCENRLSDLPPLCGLESFGWLTLSFIPTRKKEEILRLASMLPCLDKQTAGGYDWTEPEKNMLRKTLPDGCEVSFQNA